MATPVPWYFLIESSVNAILAAAFAQSMELPPPSATTKPISFSRIIAAQASTSVTSGFGDKSPKEAIIAPSLSFTMRSARPFVKKNGSATSKPFLIPISFAKSFTSDTLPLPNRILTGCK